MMMGGMGGSGGSMGMDSMMNMGGGASGSMNMGGGPAASMNMTGNMANMGNMQGMAGMDPSAMNGMANGMANQVQGVQNGMQGMPGIDPNAIAGANNGLLGGGLDSLLSGILNLAIDVFVILLFVGLIVGAVVFIKRYLFDGEILAVKPKAVCARCGQSLRSEWNACPKCGEPKVVPVNAAPQTV